jgi:predicted nucleotidyltransferase
MLPEVIRCPHLCNNGVMTVNAAADPVLLRFRRELDKVYGDGVDRVVLSGARARGDSRPDSDYDIAVFLNDSVGLWDELGKLAHITTDILDDTGALISAKPFAAHLYRVRSPLMQRIRADGMEC